MKTFSTNGTGSQQTLSEIESDKMPIYDSEADLDADLANLADNELALYVSDGSELSAPVDTVQSGNMHAVTSNAVAGAIAKFSTVQGAGTGSPEWQVLEVGTKCVCFGYNTESVPISATGFANLQLPNTLQLDKIVSADIFLEGNSGFVRGAFHPSGNSCVVYCMQTGTIAKEGCRVIVLADKVQGV